MSLLSTPAPASTPRSRTVANIKPPLTAPGDPPWLTTAINEYGTTELIGDEHNPRILEYHAVTSLGAGTDEVPWCSSFVCWVMERDGLTSTKSAASLSWRRWGKTLSTPTRGCVVVTSRNDVNGRPIPNRGHVGFYMGEVGNITYLLGGNQKNQVNMIGVRTDRVLDYRWPAMAHNSTTNMASTAGAVGTVVASTPSIMGLLSAAGDADSQVSRAVGTATTLADGLGLPLSAVMTGVGLAIALAALLYIVRERNSKIKKFGI